MPKYPPPRSDNYEKVLVDDWITGQIDEVELDEKHEFNFEGKVTVYPGIRLKFILEGCQFPHYSRWMKFTLGSKSNLFKKYVSSLIENAKPEMNIDVDCLVGLKIKTMWSENTDQQGRVWQKIEMIRPLEAKIPWNPEWEKKPEVPKQDTVNPDAPPESKEEGVDDDSVPF